MCIIKIKNLSTIITTCVILCLYFEKISSLAYPGIVDSYIHQFCLFNTLTGIQECYITLYIVHVPPVEQMTDKVLNLREKINVI